MTGLMEGKRGLIMGLANDKSLAWGIAKKLAEHGAELAFTFQGEALEKRVRPLADQLGSDIVIPCDVSDMDNLDTAFDALKQRWDTLDFVVHAIGFSDKSELRGKYVDTSLDNFLMTMNISAYSLVAVAKRARAMMPEGGSILTLTYYGAEKVIPHYNVMGVAKAALESSVKYLANDLGPENIRVNAISPGPMKTLAGSAIGGARRTYKHTESNAPLRANATLEAVGGTAVYLCSDAGACTTGEVLRVDGGMSASNWAMQFLSDIIGAQVDRPEVLETTALGAAWLAGMKAGVYPGPDEFSKKWALDRRFEPTMAENERDRRYAAWKEAVKATMSVRT